jgi:acyl-coenzyme A synthetase/AMP-(fatty) acid ligase
MTVRSSLLQLCLEGGARGIALTGETAPTADNLRRAVLSCATALRQKDESTWALWLSNPYDFLTCFLALALAGKTLVLPGDMQPATVERLGHQVDAVISRELFPGLLRPVFSPGQLTADVIADMSPPASVEVKLQLFTSGSTGEPKTVPKTLAQLEAELAALDVQWGEVFGRLPVLATVSHQHIYGLLHAVLWPFYRGALFCDRWFQYPEELCAKAAALGTVVLLSSPTHLKRLPFNEAFQNARGHFAWVVSSAGMLEENTALQLAELLGQAPLEILGSTETGGVAWRQRRKHETWRPLPGVRCSRGEQGCLRVHSAHLDAPHLESGYLMGDRVEFLDSGDFYLLGRADTLVKVEGKRVSLTAMERHLQEHPWITRARVLLLKGKREETGAVAELSPEGEEALKTSGKLAINRDLRTHLLQFFERPVLPRRWRYITEWPADAQGKVVARDLLRLLQGEEF